MKIWDLTIMGFALSIVGIIISAFILGQIYFDFTILGALLIYSIPALILSGVNGIALTLNQKLTKGGIIRIISIPILLLIGFLIDSEGPLGYIAIFGLLPIIITNLIWARKFSKLDKDASV
jgi:hypothetical protein